jgi:ribosomal protein S1
MKVRKDQTIEGEITRIVEEAVFVNIGAEREVVIPKKDIDQLRGDSSVDLKIGKTVSVHIYFAPQNGGNPLGTIAHINRTLSPAVKSQHKYRNRWNAFENEFQVGDIVSGTVKKIKKYGAFVELPNGVDGLVHVSELETGYTKSPWNVVSPGEEIKVRILDIESQKKRVRLSLKDVDEAHGD